MSGKTSIEFGGYVYATREQDLRMEKRIFNAFYTLFWKKEIQSAWIKSLTKHLGHAWKLDKITAEQRKGISPPIVAMSFIRADDYDIDEITEVDIVVGHNKGYAEGTLNAGSPGGTVWEKTYLKFEERDVKDPTRLIMDLAADLD